MPLYHIVLLKVNSDADPAKVEEFKTKAQAMVGQIPGLLKFSINAPLPRTASRGQGYNLGVVAVLDKTETLQVYADHPAHLAVNDLRIAVAEETLAYDLEYDDL